MYRIREPGGRKYGYEGEIGEGVFANRAFLKCGPKTAALALLVLFLFLPLECRADGWYDDPLERPVGRFSYGSGRLLTGLWSADQLGALAPVEDGTPAGLQWRPLPERQIPVNVRRPLPAPLRGSVRQVRLPDSERLMALTFDLCQTPDRPSGYASAVVDYLRRNRIRATFYASGIWMRTHPVRVQQLLADPLFEVGSHGWSHRNPSLQSEVQFAREVDLAQAQYELAWEELYSKAARAGLEEEMALVPRLPLTFRFPYGACSRDQFSELGEVGLPAVQWSVVPGDPDPRRTPFLLAEAILRQAHPGAIVVLHANGRGVGTAEALRLAIPRLHEAGYSFVTVSEMLAEGQPVTAQRCY